MIYALIEKGAVVAYPYNFAQLRADNPQVSFPESPDDDTLAEHGVVAVAEVARPVVDDTKDAVEGTPVLLKGAWTQTWATLDADPATIAQRQKFKADIAARGNVKADSFVQTFVAMSPDDVTSYINTNVTNLASAKAVIGKLALMVLVLARRELRD